MNKWLGIAGVTILAGLMLGGCANRAEIERLTADVSELQSERESLQMRLSRLEEEKAYLEEEKGVVLGERDEIARRVVEARRELDREKRERDKIDARIREVSGALLALIGEEVPAAQVAPRPGEANEFVALVQRGLKNAGFDPGRTDGILDRRTTETIKKFQRAKGITVDGIVGRETMGKLRPYLRR